MESVNETPTRSGNSANNASAGVSLTCRKLATSAARLIF